MLTLAIAVALAGGVQAQRRHYTVSNQSTMTRSFPFSGGDRLLDVRNINGSIHVEGTDEASLQFSVNKTVNAESDADALEAERDVRLEFIDGGARVEAIVRDRRNQVCGERSDNDGRWPQVGYDVKLDFTIRVPRRTRLRLCTINGGELIVGGTSGDFEVDNVNGRIEMRGVAGSGSAHTVNGPVTVSFTANPTEPSSFKTVNGNVEVQFRDGLSADLTMKTFNGGLFTDFEVTPLASPPPAGGERRNGRFVYRSNDFTRARVGNGGPELRFETLNGNVRALKAPR